MGVTYILFSGKPALTDGKSSMMTHMCAVFSEIDVFLGPAVVCLLHCSPQMPLCNNYNAAEFL